ncbi:hypothetical protein L6164_020358 [Bauhinia variegata]|uniref:Uncharacterized protein n=1 Tax=Bauhinia variegata TaxID=167791 RepID=A0ACB9MUV1_BAUVA|nr:hypothetical protein L6164_020358 [Bauhinia variegata]
MYNLIAVFLCRRGSSNQDSEQTSPRPVTGTPSTTESSVAHLIPAYKYHKKLDVADEDGICAVCLGSFEDGEDLKILPECLHSFHVSCIDMWLYSHSNCPICRNNVTHSLEIPSHEPDFNSNESNRRQSLDIL